MLSWHPVGRHITKRDEQMSIIVLKMSNELPDFVTYSDLVPKLLGLLTKLLQLTHFGCVSVVTCANIRHIYIKHHLNLNE